MILDKELIRLAEKNQGPHVHDVQKDIAVYTGFCRMYDKLLHNKLIGCIICTEKNPCPIHSVEDQILYCLQTINTRMSKLRKVAYP